MTDEEIGLYEEQEKIRQMLRPFSEPHPPDNPLTIDEDMMKYVERLRERDHQITLRLDEISRSKFKP